MSLRKHVVILGGGFGGLACAKALRKEAVRVTLIDRTNHHLFQPLLYQVAMAGLSPAEIAAPIRSILSRYENVTVLLADAQGVDLRTRRLIIGEGEPVEYDALVLAHGARASYYGHGEWETHAPGLKDLDDAVEIRRRVLVSFEEAERTANDEERRELLTFVVIGGGPTGVELAGSIAELAAVVLARDFRRIRSDLAKVILLEGGPRILPTFAENLSAAAERALAGMGVQVETNAQVTSVSRNGVSLGTREIAARTVLWAAGVEAVPLAGLADLARDRMGRVEVDTDCSVPGHPEVFVIGDAACFRASPDASPLPGVSQVALQQGRFVARQIARSAEPRQVFVYNDKGTMATIGRKQAVAETRWFQAKGFVAWLLWLLVHIYYLIDFRNRLAVFLQWAWSYATYRRGARIITGDRRRAGAPESPVALPSRTPGSPSEIDSTEKPHAAG